MTTARVSLSARHPGLVCAGLFLFALLIRALYVITAIVDTPIRADAAKYVQIAFNLLEHGVYSWQVGQPPVADALISPGYPLVLLAHVALANTIDGFIAQVVWCQALIGALSVVLGYQIATRILPPGWAAMCGLVLALWPNHIVMGGYLLTETWFLFWTLLGILCLLRGLDTGSRYTWMFAGLFIGIAALTRPAILLWLPMLAAVLFVVRQDLRPALLLAILGIGLAWTPWQVYSMAVKRDTTGDVSLAAAALAFGGYPDFIHHSPEWQGYPYREDPEYDAMSRSVTHTVDVLWQRATADPGRYARWYLYGKAVTFWSWEMLESRDGPFIYPVSRSIYHISTAGRVFLEGFRLLHPWLILSAFGLVLFVLVRAWRQRQWTQDLPLLICGSLMLYFTAIHIVLAPLPRYSVPMWGIAYTLALVAFYRTTGWLASRRRSSHD
jgi:4-amino-4-deoxy-L-arabinose transferase-like glycosyltransferase